MSAPFAYLDIETTGLNPMEHEVLEIAYVRETPLGPDETHFALPIDLTVANEQALAINRYHERRRELREIQIDHAQATHLLRSELKAYMIVANNPAFDISFLRELLWRSGLEPTWYYRQVDLNSMVAGFTRQLRPLRTEYIAERFGIGFEDRHTALADARWNRAVHRTLMREANLDSSDSEVH